MIAILVLILSVLMGGTNQNAVTVIPPMPDYAPTIATTSEEEEWSEFWTDSYFEHVAEFGKLFNSYETKVAKNGALMIRRGNSGSFKFARKA